MPRESGPRPAPIDNPELRPVTGAAEFFLFGVYRLADDEQELGRHTMPVPFKRRLPRVPRPRRPRILCVALVVTAGLAGAESVGPIRTARVAFSPRGDAEDVILDELRAARTRVDVAMFYLSNTILIDALCYVAAEKRIPVRLFVDEDMTKASHRSHLDRLVQSGVDVYVEDLPDGGTLHLKCAVIDGETVVTGSANWTQTAFRANCEDTLALQSPALARHYLRALDDLQRRSRPYAASGSGHPAIPRRFPSAPSLSRDNRNDRLVAPNAKSFRDVQNAEAFFTPGRAGIRRFLQRAAEARRRVDIGMYVITDDEVLDAVCRIAQSGRIAVRVIADDSMLDGPGLSDLQRMHDAGIEVLYLEDANASLHVKIAVIDDRFVLTGSHNWTTSAADRNVEDIVLLESAGLARYVRSYLDYIAGTHARAFADVSRETVATAAARPEPLHGLRRGGDVEFPDTLPATGARRDVDAALGKPESEAWEAVGTVEYLDDGEYLPVLLKLIRSARQSIVISMYHVAVGTRTPTVDRVLDELSAAAARGIYVYLVLNMPVNPSDSQEQAHHRVAEALRAKGVDVRLAVPGLQVHRKMIVVDLATIIVGSHNWSEGALTGKGVYESSALIVLPGQDITLSERIMSIPVVSDMRSRERWENELTMLRHIESLKGTGREDYVTELERELKREEDAD